MKIANYLLFILCLFPLLSEAQCGDCEFFSGNLVVNGDFSDGYTGFTTDLTNPTEEGAYGLLSDPGTYAIGNNAGNFHQFFSGFDHTFPPFGSYMVVNGSNVQNTMVWCQTIDVMPGVEYTLTFWARNVAPNPGSNDIIPSLQFVANGVELGSPVSIEDGWEEITVTWNSGSESTLELCIVDAVNTSDSNGNDYGIDDISVTGCHYYEVTYQPEAGPNIMICSGESIQLGEVTAENWEYVWTPSNGLDDPNVSDPILTAINDTDSPMALGFVMTADSLDLGCYVTDNVYITVIPLPQIEVNDYEVVCPDESIFLDAGSGWTNIEWSTGSDEQIIEVDEPGVYTVEITSMGCTASADVQVDQPILPEIDLGDDVIACDYDVVQLDAGVQTTWSTGETDDVIIADISGQYWATYEDMGCIESDTIEVTINPTPAIDLGDDLVICPEESTSLDAGFGWEDVSWSTGSDDQIIIVDEPGTYSVDVTALGCVGSDEIDVDQPNMPDIDLGEDIVACEYEEVQLDAGIMSVWSTGESGASIIADDSGEYWAVYEEMGCEESDTILVTINPTPIVDLGEDVVICPGESTLLDAGSGWDQINWSTGSDDQIIEVSDAGTYEVTVTSLNCEGSDQVVVSQPDIPIVDLGPDQSICEDETVELITDVDCAWSTGEVSSSITINETGTYWASYEELGCTTSDTVFVEVIQYPSLELGEDIVRCAHDTIVLTLSQPGLWSNGATTDSLTILVGGYYTVTLQNQQCAVTDDIYIEDIPYPIVELERQQGDLCLGEEVELGYGIENADSVFWSTGDSTEVLEIKESGAYFVEALNTCGSATDTVVYFFEDCDYSIYIPNAFTPDGDDLNENLRIYTHNIEDYHIQIYDRWGTVIWESYDSLEYWTGNVRGGDYYAPDSVYFYRVTGITTRNIQIDKYGTITLIR